MPAVALALGSRERQLLPVRMGSSSPIDVVRRSAAPLTGTARDHEPLLALIGDARIVLLGEASHGTHEFYAERAAITRRLIAERGFDAVVIEGDWPDSQRVNRHVVGLGDDRTAGDALAGFQRFPTWLWRNREVASFVKWLRGHNHGRDPHARIGFYGLDLYSLRTSMAAVIDYLARNDPAAAQRARQRYACFDQFGTDVRQYGLLARLGVSPLCTHEVMAMLVDLRRHGAQVAARDPHDGASAFDAEQNARLVKNAEGYYRATVLRGDASSWNRRDRHMAETLDELERHLGGRLGRAPKLVVWAHNSHVGDARATEMGQQRGELSLGQLVRRRHRRDAVLVGFTTHEGSVMAASHWDGPHAVMRVPAAPPDSIERLLHATGIARFLLPLRDSPELQAALQAPRRQRAIGVIYRPDTELQSHCLQACLPRQFDAVLHIDVTRAVTPLDAHEPASAPETPETYPSGV
jgi:erythromycin esterase-like protein